MGQRHTECAASRQTANPKQLIACATLLRCPPSPVRFAAVRWERDCQHVFAQPFTAKQKDLCTRGFSAEGCSERQPDLWWVCPSLEAQGTTKQGTCLPLLPSRAVPERERFPSVCSRAQANHSPAMDRTCFPLLFQPCWLDYSKLYHRASLSHKHVAERGSGTRGALWRDIFLLSNKQPTSF